MTKRKRKTIKAWAVIDKRGAITKEWGDGYPYDIFYFKIDAMAAAFEENAVVRCLITYTVPKKSKPQAQ